MSQAESNRVDVRFAVESVWNETPASPAMTSLPYTSESFAYAKDTVKSSIVRADRLTDDIIEVGAGSSGEVNFEYKFGDFDRLIEGAMGNNFTQVTFTGTSNMSFAVAAAGVQVITGPANWTVGYVVGTYVRVTNANAQNIGVYRITALTATLMTITNALGTVQASTSATVLMRYARTGTLKKSYVFEKSFGDIARFISFRGQRVGSWAMNIESGQIITGSFGLVGAGAFAATSTISGSIVPAGVLSIASATANVGRFEEGGTALATKVKAVKFNLNANVRQLRAVANKFPIAINLGSFDITGSVEAYFEDLTLYNKFIGHSDSSLVFEITSAENDSTVITITNLKFTNAAPVGAGLNQDVMVTMDFMGQSDAVTASMMQVDLLT